MVSVISEILDRLKGKAMLFQRMEGTAIARSSLLVTGNGEYKDLVKAGIQHIVDDISAISDVER